MRVLLIGNGLPYHIGAFLKRALEQLGHEYRLVDEAEYFEQSSLWHKITHRLVGRPLAYGAFNRAVLENARYSNPQVVVVVKGSYLNPQVLSQVKALTGATLVNYATDDPFNHNASTKDVVDAIPLYDLYASPRRANIADLRQAGARQPVHAPFGYDPAVHFPESPAGPHEAKQWASDVVFVGGADRDRWPYLEAVARIPGTNLRLYGGYWNRNSCLRPYACGFALGRNYRLALTSSKLALCLVRHANRDGHVMRTFEIPACGTFMLAERTDEHLELFREGQEIACFTSVEEMVDKIRYYLTHADRRLSVAQAGYQKVTTGRHTYRDRLSELLELVNKL